MGVSKDDGCFLFSVSMAAKIQGVLRAGQALWVWARVYSRLYVEFRGFVLSLQM